MVLIDHSQAVQTTRQTTTSSTNVDITSVSIADSFFNTGEKYLIIASAQLDTASTAEQSGITTLHGSTEFDGADQFMEHPVVDPQKHDYFYFTVWTAVASEGVKMQFRTGGAGTTGADQVVLTAIRLNDLTENTDWHFDENLTDTTLGLSFSTTNNAVVTFTPSTGGDNWLVLSRARVTPDAGLSNQMISRFSRSGEASFNTSTISQEREIAGDFIVQPNMHVFNLGASSNTFTQESRVDESAGSDSRTDSAIFAINLASFSKDSSSATTTGAVNLTTTNFGEEIESISITPDSTVDVFCIGGWVLDNGLVGGEGRLQVDNTDSPATQTSDAYDRNQGFDGKDEVDFLHQTIINLDNTLHTVDLDGSAVSSGTNVLNSHLVAFTLETSGATVSTKTFTVDAFIQALGDNGVCGGSGSTVQSGTAQIATADATEDVSITAVDLSKSFVVFNYRVDSTNPSRFLVKATLTSTTNIRFERDNTSGTNTPVDITWYVVESDDLTVQRGNNSMTTGVSNQTITAVDLSKAFRLTSMMNDNTSWGEADLLKSRLTTTTNLELETNTVVNLTDAVHWQVAEFEGASVQRGVATVDETMLSTDVTISSVDLTKSFVLIDSSLSGVPENPANGCLRATLTSATNLHIERESFNATDTHTIAWEVVELPTDVTVQSGTESFTTSETQNNVTITAVGLSNTFVILSSRQREGQSSDLSGSNPHTAWFSAELTSTTNLQLTRAGSDSSTADVEWYVVELATAGKQRSCPEVDAIIVITPTQKTFTVDAILAPIKDFTVDSMLKDRKTKTFTIDARLQSANELTYKFVEVTTEQSHTGDTLFTDISGATIPSSFFVAGRKYLLVMTTQTVGTNINTNYGVRTIHGSTEFDGSKHVYEPNAVVTRTQYSYFNVWTAVEGESIQMQFQTMSAGQTVNADQTTLFALEISEDFVEGTDWHFDSIVASTTLATTPSTSNNGTITFTPPVAGNDWLVISTGDIDTDANNVIYTSRTARSGEATSTTPSTTAEGEDSPLDDYVQTVFRVFTLGNASNTFEQEAFKSANPGPNSTREYSSIFAINLDKFLSHSFAYTDGTIALDTTDDLSTSTQVQTDTLAPAIAGDTWIMGSFVTSGNAFQEIRARMQVDNVDQPPTQTSDNYQQLLGYDPVDESNWAIQTVEDLDTSSHTTDIDVTAETGSPSDRTAQFRNIFEVRLQSFAVEANTETFTVDALIRDRVDKDFTVDAFIKALNQEETFDVDAFIQQSQTKDFTVDAILLTPQTETFTIDAFVQALDTEKTFTVDAVLQATFTFDFTVDAFIQALNQEETFDVDALIQAENQKMFLVDGLAQATQTETFDIDSIVVDRFTEDFTVDAKVIVRRTTTFDIDGLPQEQNIDKVFTIDAFIQEQDNDETFTIDGFPQATFTEDFEVDAFVQALNNEEDFLIDAFVQALNQEEPFTIDGFLQDTFTEDFLIDGLPQATIDEDFTVDSFIQALNQEADFTVDSFIQKLDNDKTFLVDAKIAIRPEENFDIDGLIQGANTKTFNVDALIEAETEKMFLVDARLLATFDEDFLIDGLTRGTQTETFSIDARIAQLNTETFDVDALIEDIFTEDFTVDAVIEDVFDKDFTVDSKLLATQTKTFLIDAQITEINAETFTVDSLISKEQTTTYEVDAQIQQAQTKAFTIDSKLSRIKVFKIDAQIVRVERFDVDSILQATTDADFLIDGLITVAGQKLFLVDAFLVTVNSEDFTVDSVLAEVKTVDYDIDALIQEQDNEKTFVIDGLLPTTNQEAFDVDSMTRARIDEDFETDAVVLKEQGETFEIDAHIQNGFTKDFTIDGLVKALNTTKTFTVDTFSQLAKTIDFTIDARVELENSETFTVDANVQQTPTEDFTIDGQLFAILTFTKDFDVDSLLKATQTTTFLIDGVPVDPSSKIFSIDALLQALDNNEVFTVDAKVVVVNTETFDVDAQIIPIATNTKDFEADAFVRVLDQEEEFTVDSQLAVLDRTIDFTVEGTIKGAKEIEFTVDAVVTGGITKTFTVDAQIFLPTLANFTVDGFLIQPASLLEFTVDAKVQSPFTEDFLVDAITFVFPSQLITVDGLTLGTQTKDFTIDADLRNIKTTTFDIDGLIFLSGDLLCSVSGDVFSDDISSNAGWTVSGSSQVFVDSGSFPNVIRAECFQSRLYSNAQAIKSLGIILPSRKDLTWEFKYRHLSPCGGSLADVVFALTETSTITDDIPQGAIKFRTTHSFPSNTIQKVRAEILDSSGASVITPTFDDIGLIDATFFMRISIISNGSLLRLEVFSDSARTNLLSSIPDVDITSISSENLEFIQVSPIGGGGPARQAREEFDDILINAGRCPTFEIDSVLRGEIEKEFTVDAVIVTVKKFTVDTLLKESETLKSFSVDAFIGLPKKQFLVDAILSTQGKFTVDAFLITINSKTFEIDSAIKALNQEETFTIDAEVTRGKIFLVDSILKLTANELFTVDTILSGIKEFDIDGRLVDRFEEDFTVDGSTLGTAEKDFTIDGILIVFPSGLILIDARIQALNQEETFDVDSRVKALETTKNFTVDSQLVQDEIPKQFTIDGRIIVIQTTTFDIDGVIKLAGENGMCNFFPSTNLAVDTGFEQFIGPVQPVHEAGVEMLIGQEVVLNNQQVRSVTFLLRSTNFPNEITTNSLINAEIWRDVIVGFFGGEITVASSNNVINAINTSGDLPPGDWTKVKFTFDIITTPFLTGNFVVGFKHLSTVDDPKGVGTAVPVISNSNVISGSAVQRKGQNSLLGDEDEWTFLFGNQKDMIIQLEVLNGDDIILGEGNQCPLVDAVLVNLPSEFLVDAILTNRFESEFSVDTILFPFPKPFSIDAVLVGTQLQFIVDSIIVPEPKTFTVDGIRLVVPGKVYSVDALLQPFIRFEVDGLVQAISKKSPKFNLNAFLFVRRTKDFTVDGSTKFFNQVAPFTIDAQVIFFPSQLPQVDGLVRALGVPKFFFVDAFVQRLDFNFLRSIDGLIVKENIGKTFLVGGLIEQGDNEKDFTIDAKLGSPQAPFLFSVDAITNLQNGRWQTDALLQKSIKKLFLVDSLLVENPQKLFLIDGSTLGTVDKTFIIDGLIPTINQEIFIVDARIVQINPADYTVNAIIKGIGLTLGFTLDASLVRIREFLIDSFVKAFNQTKIFTIDARVGTFEKEIIGVDAIVKALNQEKDFTITAKVAFVKEVDFTVDALLIGSQDFTVSAFVGDTLFVGIEAESVIVENNSTNGVESVIVENNSDSGVESVIGQDT